MIKYYIGSFHDILHFYKKITDVVVSLRDIVVDFMLFKLAVGNSNQRQGTHCFVIIVE